jgi:Clostripain family
MKRKNLHGLDRDHDSFWPINRGGENESERRVGKARTEMEERTGKWTVAIYLAGGDNVSREMIPALHDMRDAALANRSSLRVLAQFEPDAAAPRIYSFGWRPPSKGPRSTPAARLRSSTSLGLDNFQWETSGGEEDAPKTSSIQRLETFVATARAASVDDNVMLVISGHGNGAVGEFLGYRSNHDPMYLTDLRAALATHGSSSRKIDILGLDCCNMSMVEVGFELADCARFMVASEGYILNHGWPYRPILDAMPDAEPEMAGGEIVRQFVGSYSDYALVNVASHCALCNLERIELLAEPVRRLSRRLIASIDDPDVWRPAVLAHWEAQSYKDEEYVDLGDFCDRLRAHIADPEVQSACSAILEALGRVVVVSCVSGSTFQYSTGLSVYFPWCHDAVKCRPDADGASTLESYQKLEFSRETGWGEFLDAYLVATRREPPRRRTPSYPASETYQTLAMVTSDVGGSLAVRRSLPRKALSSATPQRAIVQSKGGVHGDKEVSPVEQQGRSRPRNSQEPSPNGWEWRGAARSKVSTVEQQRQQDGAIASQEPSPRALVGFSVGNE